MALSQQQKRIPIESRRSGNSALRAEKPEENPPLASFARPLKDLLRMEVGRNPINDLVRFAADSLDCKGMRHDGLECPRARAPETFSRRPYCPEFPADPGQGRDAAGATLRRAYSGLKRSARPGAARVRRRLQAALRNALFDGGSPFSLICKGCA